MNDLKGADKTVDLITDSAEKVRAQRWLKAGRIVQAEGDLAKATDEQHIKILEIASELREILERKVAQKDIATARRILTVLPTGQDHASGLLAIAEYELEHAPREQCLETVREAEKETDAIEEDDVLFIFAGKAAEYILMARLYFKIGENELGTSTVEKCLKEASKDRNGVLKEMGSSLDTISLFIQAGKIDEAERMAKRARESGMQLRPKISEALAKAYAVRGQTAKAEELLKTPDSDLALAEINVYAAEAVIKQLRGSQQ